MKLGFAGQISKKFLNSKLTLLFVLVSLILGVFSVIMTAKEEEPQIKVPMIDVMIPVPGYSPTEVEKRVSNVVEREMSSLIKVKHVYSTSMEDFSLVTVRFEVGEDLETSLVKVHHKMMQLKGKLPNEIMEPTVKSYTIDDVPFYSLTFFSKELNSSQIRHEIFPVVKKLQEIDGVAELSYIGGERKVVRVSPDLGKLQSYGITLVEMKDAVEKSSSEYTVGVIRERSPEPLLAVGSFVKDLKDIENIPVGRRLGKTLKLSDVASIKYDFDNEKNKVLHGKDFLPAVTVTFTKKKGTNATILAQDLKIKLDELLKSASFTDKISYEVTRDYGATAKEKSDELLEHLLIATVSVMVLIALAMGFRVSLVVGIAVPVTLAMTLLIYYLMGYTLNRVTLFALIFSIGILVDDAIVVVENIYRHLALGKGKDRDETINHATDEVGNPTILATLTVIVAIMPMAFVGGMMGPYMRPIPIGASMAMIFSLFIAFIVTPWASKRLIGKNVKVHEEHHDGFFSKMFRKIMSWIVERPRNSIMVGVVVFIMLLGSMSLVGTKHVKVKMLPFDNKSEFQVLIDMPPGSTLKDTEKLAREMSTKLYSYKEVKDIQAYVGTAAPFNFSGMVKHTFMRANSYRADLQVNLLSKHERDIQSHPLVTQIREEIMKEFGSRPGLEIRFLEIPPGPPVMSTLLGEIYHPDAKTEEEATKKLAEIYRSINGVVETDTTYDQPQSKVFYDFDRERGMVHGVPQKYAAATMLMGLGDLNLFPLHIDNEEESVFMRLTLSDNVKKSDAALLSLLVPSMEGDKLPLSKVFKVEKRESENPIYHKDLKKVSYVMAEVAGAEESPFYAIQKMSDKLTDYEVTYTHVPHSITKPVLKWDGEMDITIEVFRDMGIAFLIAVIFILIIVIGWYNSFILPLIIIVPIPLTLIGIIPGHWMVGAFFTATSMIGFIAGAGITVRNSIILVDFIEMKRAEGLSAKDAVIESTIVRFRPILLTALAVLVAGVVILFDPIFQGLAISLMAGSIISALLSIPLVPVLYYWLRKDKQTVQR